MVSVSFRFPIFSIFQPFKLGQTLKLQKKKQLHNFQPLSNPQKKHIQSAAVVLQQQL